MSRHPARLHSTGPEDPLAGNAGGEKGGLGYFREAQSILGSLEADSRDGETQRVVGFLKHMPRLREGSGHETSHPGGLGSLTWEQESDGPLAHGVSRSTRETADRAATSGGVRLPR